MRGAEIMKVKVIGKNIEVTSALKDVIERKLTKFEKYFDPSVVATVKLSVVKNNHIIEVTIPFNGVILRGEEATADMYTSLDKVCDKLDGQMRKQKTKLEKRYHGDSLRFKDIPSFDEDDNEESKIVKVKKFDVKPMSQEEAILQMELLGHSFFVFKNAEDLEVNVVYKRKDGNYGLIVSEF